MDCLNSYIEARRIAGTYDDAPPTERTNPIPLDCDEPDFEPTIIVCQGIPPCLDDPCEICIAGDIWGES